MNGRIGCIFLGIGLLAFFSGTVSAQERWVYRYDGPGGSADWAKSVITGSDGNLYVAGYSVGSGTEYDFTVVSLTVSGTERWVYRYNGSDAGWDIAHSIVAGADSALYAAGSSSENGTSEDFAVVSLTFSGVERWIYRYDGPGNGIDGAYSIVAGTDGSLYAAGYSRGSGTGLDLTAVSLTESGVERWVYRYNGPGSGSDLAGSIVMGSDGHLYIAGYSSGIGTFEDFTVVSLTDSGTERWVYRYDGPGSGSDLAYSVVAGSDGNIYAVGESEGSGTWFDFTVVSLTDSGTERWVYRYNSPVSSLDRGFSLVMGSDGYIYAAGTSSGSGTSIDFAVVSLTSSGVERWVHRYDGPGHDQDLAYSVVTGPDGNIYAAGTSWGSGTYTDFTVLSLTPFGEERWNYRYDGPGSGSDGAYSIVAGPDGNLYAAGYSGTSTDLTVVGLFPDVGAQEEPNRPSVSDLRLLENSPNPFRHSTAISYSLPATSQVTLSIYDITGRLVETLVNETQQPGIHQVRWNRKRNPSGVYFYRLKACPERSSESAEPRSRRAGEFVETRKMVIVE